MKNNQKKKNKMNEEEIRMKEHIEKRSEEIRDSARRTDESHKKMMALFSDIGLKVVEEGITIDEEKLGSGHKDLIAPMLVLNIDERTKSIHEFLTELQKNLRIIETYNPELAEQIKNVKLTDEINDEKILSRLKNVLDYKNKEEVFSHFEKYPDFYHRTLIGMKDQKLSQQLIFELSTLNGTEIRFLESEIQGLENIKLQLNQYIEHMETELEQKYRLKDSILIRKLNKIKEKDMKEYQQQILELEEFYKEIEIWNINGNNFEVYRKRVLQLLAYFGKKYKNHKLIKDIMGTEGGRLFLRYDKLCNHVLGEEHWDVDKFAKKGIRGVVEATYRDEKGNWQHFVPLVKNVDKEAEYIVKTFGDKLVADEINKIAETCKEGTKCWLDHLNALEKNVVRNDERLRNILVVVQKIFLNFVRKNVEQLGKELKSDKEKVRNILLDRIKDLNKRRKKSLTEMKKLVDKGISKIRKEPEKIKKSIIDSAVKARNDAITKFAEQIKTINTRLEEAKYLEELKTLREKYEEWLNVEEVLNKDGDMAEIISNQLKWFDYLQKAYSYQARSKKTDYSVLMNITRGIGTIYQAEKTKSLAFYEASNHYIGFLNSPEFLERTNRLQTIQNTIAKMLEYMKKENFIETQFGEA